MLLSEAILLGTVTIPRMVAGTLDGCALGMAANCVGIKRDYDSLAEQWPWLGSAAKRICKCSVYGNQALYIAHLFDTHIMDIPTMTLEQLVDYVRSIEPQESIFDLPDISLEEQHRLEEIESERESLDPMVQRP